MQIIVCVKHVVDSTEVRIDKKSGELVLRGVPTKINDYDRNAIEEAVKIKKATGGSVTLLTVAPSGAAFKTMKEGLAMGADQAYIIDDADINTNDPLEVARVLAAGIRKIGSPDVIFCGSISEDMGNSLIGPSVAEMLGIEHVAYVSKVGVEQNGLTVERRVGDMFETLETYFPVLITVERSINIPRLPTAIQVMKVPTKNIIKWSLDDVGYSPKAKYVELTGYNVVSRERKNIIIEGDIPSAVDQLFEHLKEEGVL